MAKTISKDNEVRQNFLTAAEPPERGASGVQKSIIAACSATLGENAIEAAWLMAPKLTSVSPCFVFFTGESGISADEKNCLPVLLDRYFDLLKDELVPKPKIKIWRATHRFQLQIT